MKIAIIRKKFKHEKLILIKIVTFRHENRKSYVWRILHRKRSERRYPTQTRPVTLNSGTKN